MNILCDTCSVLMLIRIAPDMFTDEQFNCLTVSEVRKEIFGTQKFKTKYPWRTEFKNKIIINPKLSSSTDDYSLYFDIINQLVESGKISQKTQRTFGLSFVDKKIGAYGLAYELDISSTDNDLIDFLNQEFGKINKSPLCIINEWISNGLIKWDSNLNRIIEDWDKCGEPRQPAKDIAQFEKLTDIKYLGP